MTAQRTGGVYIQEESQHQKQESIHKNRIRATLKM